MECVDFKLKIYLLNSRSIRRKRSLCAMLIQDRPKASAGQG